MKFKAPLSKLWKCTNCFQLITERALHATSALCPKCRNDEFDEVFSWQTLSLDRETDKACFLKLWAIHKIFGLRFIDGFRNTQKKKMRAQFPGLEFKEVDM